MKLEEKLEKFYRRQNFGIKMGLDVTYLMLEKLGNPHHEFASIHVAGTNGKGSIAAMTASILGKAGYRVGLYTSPHLIDLRERIQVGGTMIPLSDLKADIKEVRANLGRDEVTYFEFLTAIAFLHSGMSRWMWPFSKWEWEAGWTLPTWLRPSCPSYPIFPWNTGHIWATVWRQLQARRQAL